MRVSKTIFVGIDPGITGALGAIDSHGEFIAVVDLPVMANGKGTSKVETQINPEALLKILVGLEDLLPERRDAVVVGLERIASMPGQGVASMFSMGDSFGICRAVVACWGMRLELITPQVWKKYFNLPPKDEKAKETARAKAIQIFPGAELHLKKHHNRAEALLIAEYIRMTS
jgi:crossover junction endodeoxyribonuclease RuvC